MNAGPVEVAAAIEARIKESKTQRDKLPAIGDARTRTEVRYDVALGMRTEQLKKDGMAVGMIKEVAKKDCATVGTPKQNWKTPTVAAAKKNAKKIQELQEKLNEE